MTYEKMSNEMKYLARVTNKSISEIVNYYHKCYSKINRNEEHLTEYQFNEYENKTNNLILSFIRDYALFDIDDSNLLSNYNLDDDELFNCCGIVRLL